MKTSAVLASLFFGACAVAAPVDKRDVVTTTQVVTETVVVYTTVYDYEEGPAPTSSQGLFYEQPAQSTTVAAYPTSAAAPAYTPPAPVEPSKVYTPVPQPPAPTPEAPKEEPKPTSAAYVAPAPTPAAPAPAPVQSAPPTTNHQTTGQQYTGVDLTIYNGNGDLGACGKKIIDTEFVAAVGQGVWGKSTYDVMTGESTNPWCGKKIEISYNGRTVQATVLDLCPGCTGPNDVDLTMAAFQVVTGSQEITRYHGASWAPVS